MTGTPDLMQHLTDAAEHRADLEAGHAIMAAAPDNPVYAEPWAGDG
jgi:hypothetical protein